MVDFAISPELGTADAFGQPALPRITDARGFQDLPAGTEFFDPEGKKRKKPYVVTDAATFEAVPEGETFIDPEGKRRQKPAYQGVDLTTQTLYDMALNDKERMNILARGYGKDSVKQAPGSKEFYVEDENGVLRKPGHGSFAKRAGAAIASEAAPVVGAIGGGILGGGGGTPAAPGPGTVAGAIAGAAGGAAAGQGLNDLILGLAGVYDRSLGEEALNIGGAAASGGVGEGVGRAAIAAYPFAKAAITKAPTVLGRTVGNIVGAYKVPGAIERAGGLAAKGVLVRPSAWMSESPYLKSVVEEFDPVFRQQDVLSQSAGRYYENEGGRILEDLGVPAAERKTLTEATERPSSAKAGEAMRARVKADLAREDAALEAATENARIAARGRGQLGQAIYDEAMQGLTKAHDAATATAQTAIDKGFVALRNGVSQAVETAKTGGNPGDLVRAMVGKLRGFRAAIGQRASILYRAADSAAGDARPDIGTLPADAKAFLESLPKPFQDKYPDIVKKLTELAGVKEEGITEWEAGQIARVRAGSDTNPTFAQIRNLRSMLRQDIDYNDLTPSIRDGVFARFEDKIDAIIHDAKARPELKTAAELLDKADAFYAKNIRTFKHEGIRGIMRFMEAGLPPDAKTLAGTLLQKDTTEFIERVRRIAGKPLWGAVQAADTQAMFDASKTLAPGKIDGGKFASEVLKRIQDGILDKAYDKETAARLQTQAQRILASEGRLDITVAPGDTVMTALKRAADAKEAISLLAKHDPLATLTKELAQIEKDFAAQSAAVQATRKADPLRLLQSPTVGAMESADRILRNPDMLLAAAARFGHDSPEFTMLRQVGAWRLLQRSLGKTAKTAGYLESTMPEEVQHLLFPGVTRTAMVELAKNMEFLLGGEAAGAGGSIAAKSRVLHPTGSFLAGIPGLSVLVKEAKFPGLDFLLRMGLTKYYATITKGVTHPAFVQWVAKGLKAGPAARAMVRAEWQRAMNIGGGTGAGVGETLYQQPNEQTPEPVQ